MSALTNKRVWSDYQKAVFEDIARGKGHTAVIAVAGSGKTSVIVEGFKYIPKKMRTLMVAFNKATCEELKERAPSYVDASTLHGLGFRAIRNAFGKAVKLNPDKTLNIITELFEAKGFKRQQKNGFDTVMSLQRTTSLCKSFMLDIPSAIDEIMDRFDIDTGLLEREDFIKLICQTLRKCKEIKDYVDFDDMIYFPASFGLALGKWDRVFCDEVQDFSTAQVNMILSSCKPNGRITAVGDPKQCVDENTIVKTENGKKLVRNVKVGDKILSYENGSFVYKEVLNKVKSGWSEGIKITTKSGKVLTMSPNHKIWAEQQTIKGQFVVYLMYRSDLGFRVGKTNKWRAEPGHGLFGSRPRQEGANKLWVLELVDTNEEAIFLEECYSLEFGVPKAVFEGAGRGLNQERIDKIFNIFGKNGYKLLEKKGLLFDYPHWQQGNSSMAKYKSFTLRINSHLKNKKYTQLSIEFSDKNIKDLMVKNGFDNFKTYKKNKPNTIEHYSYRKCNKNYTQMYNLAQNIAKLIGANITENLSYKKDRDCKLITASGLFLGMNVLCDNDNGELIDEEIISIEKNTPGIFYDLEIKDTANFFGNDIISHNSIYSWRGADSNSVENLITRLDAKQLPLSITYRCPKSVVKLAQEFVPHLEASTTAKEGLVKEIPEKTFLDLVRPGDYILSRVNAPLIYYCMRLLRNKIPANIQGKDIGANLAWMIKKSEKKTVIDFLKWLDDWKAAECARLRAKNRDPILILDKAECLESLCEGCKSTSEVLDNIKELFTNGDDKDRVICGSIHSVKGGERDRVFLLAWTLRKNMNQEENNICYVAYTRAKEELYLVKK